MNPSQLLFAAVILIASFMLQNEQAFSSILIISPRSPSLNMANIRALLNPMSERRVVTPHTPTIPAAVMPSPGSPRKKAKLTKDAPVFQHGPVRGECRFPPDEFQDEKLAAYHQQFEVTPFGSIADYPRHIPYNSEKKTFLEKTNREFLEVFQYTFKKPGDDTLYTMLWDYNIGLVRTTPLFKCTGYSKTTPAKMLTKNPGLKDICHSITGGALVAQGYWMPHAAAKAIAATFCYDIRYALTPVFGHDFPDSCIRPGTEGYGEMMIDPAVTRQCSKEAERFRQEEPNTTPQISAAVLHTRTPSPSSQRSKTGQAKAINPLQSPYSSPYLSPYNSDISSDDNYTLAPTTPMWHNPWTPINSLKTPPRSVPYPDRHLPSPRALIASHGARLNMMIDIPLTPPPTVASRDTSLELSPTALPCQHVSALRSTYRDTPELVARIDVEQKLSDAISIMSSVTGLDRVEVIRRLGISEHEADIDQRVEAAITMESMKTGIAWGEVAKRVGLHSDRHKRSASW